MVNLKMRGRVLALWSKDDVIELKRAYEEGNTLLVMGKDGKWKEIKKTDWLLNKTYWIKEWGEELSIGKYCLFFDEQDPLEENISIEILQYIDYDNEEGYCYSNEYDAYSYAKLATIENIKDYMPKFAEQLGL